MSVEHPVTTSGDVTVVVLAGGTSRRFGSDKLAAPLGGSTVLDTVLGSLPPASTTTVTSPLVAAGRWTLIPPVWGAG